MKKTESLKKEPSEKTGIIVPTEEVEKLLKSEMEYDNQKSAIELPVDISPDID